MMDVDGVGWAVVAAIVVLILGVMVGYDLAMKSATKAGCEFEYKVKVKP